MTLTTTLARIPYSASSGETSLPVPFKVQRAEDLQIWLTPSGGSASLLVYGTHYNVTHLFESTCTVTLVTPAVAGDLYLILRIVEIEQDLALRTQGRYDPQSTERELDRIVMMIQQVDALTSSTNPANARALLLGVNDVIGSGAYDALSNRIEHMDDPTADQDAATKIYVDTAVAGVAGGGGGGSFIAATVTQAALPSPAVAFDGLVYRVREAALPDVLYVCLRQSSGTTYEWVAFASAFA